MSTCILWVRAYLIQLANNVAAFLLHPLCWYCVVANIKNIVKGYEWVQTNCQIGQRYCSFSLPHSNCQYSSETILRVILLLINNIFYKLLCILMHNHFSLHLLLIQSGALELSFLTTSKKLSKPYFFLDVVRMCERFFSCSFVRGPVKPAEVVLRTRSKVKLTLSKYVIIVSKCNSLSANTIPCQHIQFKYMIIYHLSSSIQG